MVADIFVHDSEFSILAELPSWTLAAWDVTRYLNVGEKIVYSVPSVANCGLKDHWRMEAQILRLRPPITLQKKGDPSKRIKEKRRERRDYQQLNVQRVHRGQTDGEEINESH